MPNRDHDQTTDKQASANSAAALKASTDDIRKDIEALKADVSGLAAKLRDVGVAKAQEASGYVQERFGDLQEAGPRAVTNLEARVREKPVEAITMAFCVGALLSICLGRRS